MLNNEDLLAEITADTAENGSTFFFFFPPPFFEEETRPRVETEGMPLPQPPESAGQKRRFSRKKWKSEWTKDFVANDLFIYFQKIMCSASFAIVMLNVDDWFRNFVNVFRKWKTIWR